ncbi:MAG: hypothetical protein OXI56_07755 [bacterium]|nr:hypothetical protein [bacterium]MDE0601671.1 hypothetical protein [bacterium]
MIRNRWLPRNQKEIGAGLSLAAISFMALAAFSLPPASPTLAYSSHLDPIPVCPGPIMEGESDRVGMRWDGPYPFAPVRFHTTSVGHAADPSDYSPDHPVEVASDGVNRTLWVTVHARQDSKTEHDETFEVGIALHSGWFSCSITILDDDAPSITGVAITSDPARGDTYRNGEYIEVTLTFDQAVDVAGDASVTLHLAVGDQTAPREASYLRGSGTRRLVFGYQVQPTDRDSDGIAVSPAIEDQESITGFTGTVYARGTTIPIDYTHAGIERAPSHKVDGRPYVKNVEVISTPQDGWEAYRADQTIEIALTFDMDVEVEGEVRLALYVGLSHDNWAEAWREADYLRGSGTDTLVFGYTVQPGDTDIRGIAIPYGATAVLGSGTIKARGTDVEYLEHFPATGHLPGHKIDTASPSVGGVYITSWPADREAYGVGETIRVEVVFTEPVTKTGDLQLELDIGGTTRYASLRPDANPNRRYNNDMVFEYRVQEADADSDGIGINANSLNLNGGAIHDRAGNAADLSHEPVTADPRHMVNTNP